MGFNPDEYEQVADRIPLFWEAFPNGRIETEMISYDEEKGTVVFVARLFREGEDTPFATGWAREVRGDGFVNKTSHVENCETSALGRVLANACFSDKNKPRPSREEMSKPVCAGEKVTATLDSQPPPESEPALTVVPNDITKELKELGGRGKDLGLTQPQIRKIASEVLGRKISKAADISTSEEVEAVQRQFDEIEQLKETP